MSAESVCALCGCILTLGVIEFRRFLAQRGREAILERMREIVDERDFDTWFRGTRQSGEPNGTLRVVVASNLFPEYVSSEYGEVIREIAGEHGVDQPIDFVVGV